MLYIGLQGFQLDVPDLDTNAQVHLLFTIMITVETDAWFLYMQGYMYGTT